MRFTHTLTFITSDYVRSYKIQRILKGLSKHNYSWLSLSRTRKGLEILFEVERVRDKERKIGYILHKGAESLVRAREKFEIEGVRDRESKLYIKSADLIALTKR